MSKGNLFLGMARGSVGDVTFYRMDGEQIARARNRHPRNPKSFAQMLQRATNASISRLYSLGSQLFDHSFEGRAVGKENQRRFMTVNMAKLRELLVTEFNLQPGDSNLEVARIGAPGLTVAVPFAGLVVSEGTYQQNFFAWDQATGLWKAPQWTEQGVSPTVKLFAEKFGLVPGDIYTLGAIAIDQQSEPLYMAPGGGTGDEGNGLAIRQSYFFFEQFKVKAGVLDDSTAVTSTTPMSAFFDVYLSQANLLSLGDIPIVDAANGFAPLNANPELEIAVGGTFIIRSKEGSDLRSNSRLQAITNYGQNTKWGLTARFLEDAWLPGTQLEANELILDGSEF